MLIKVVEIFFCCECMNVWIWYMWFILWNIVYTVKANTSENTLYLVEWGSLMISWKKVQAHLRPYLTGSEGLQVCATKWLFFPIRVCSRSQAVEKMCISNSDGLKQYFIYSFSRIEILDRVLRITLKMYSGSVTT